MTDYLGQMSKLTKGVHTSTAKKTLLLEAATRGESRPADNTSLGRALRQYTYPQAKGYDKEFTKQINEIAPHWMERKYNSDTKKTKIVELAAQGADKSKLTELNLNNAFRSYISAQNSSYDEEFTKQIKELAPNWFSQTPEEKKIRLLTLAKTGASKPLSNTSLGRYLNKLTLLGNDNSFLVELYSIAPSWK